MDGFNPMDDKRQFDRAWTEHRLPVEPEFVPGPVPPNPTEKEPLFSHTALGLEPQAHADSDEDWIEDLKRSMPITDEGLPPPVVELPKSAHKADAGKPRMSLVPQTATLEIAKIMTFGAKKYGAGNWKKGFTWTRLLDATLRHLNAFARGEDNDPETGASHLAHAGCEIMMLLESVVLQLGEDDR